MLVDHIKFMSSFVGVGRSGSVLLVVVFMHISGVMFFFGKPKKPWPWKLFTKKLFILNGFSAKTAVFLVRVLFHQHFQGTIP